MIIIPAIDLRGGNPVRLYKGNYENEEIVGENALEIAKCFEKSGAEYIHIVDLDGAKTGKSENRVLIKKIVECTSVDVEVGGGIRKIEDIEELIDSGVARVILGTAAIKNQEFLITAIEKYGDKIAVAVDCRKEKVCVNGWIEESNIDCLDFCKDLERLSVKTIIVTDIEKDGTLEGCNIKLLEKLQQQVSINIVASGGIKNIEDIKALNKLNVQGAITGKAIYSKHLNLEEAINITKNI
ncbi:MAG: 1-(5-phosphoribosyl)-5-[(5-phosphoribosylamino)methylideneamino]imidazole-4-carboxamide isomerase [Sarcina sp.]